MSLIGKLIMKVAKNTFDSKYPYQLGDKVVVDDSIFVCIIDESIGEFPPTSPNWMRIL